MFKHTRFLSQNFLRSLATGVKTSFVHFLTYKTKLRFVNGPYCFCFLTNVNNIVSTHFLQEFSIEYEYLLTRDG